MTGTGITLTASASLFVPAHVGSMWRIEENAGHLNYGDWEPTKNYSGGQKVKFADRVYETAAGGTSGTARRCTPREPRATGRIRAASAGPSSIPAMAG